MSKEWNLRDKRKKLQKKLEEAVRYGNLLIVSDVFKLIEKQDKQFILRLEEKIELKKTFPTGYITKKQMIDIIYNLVGKE